MTPETIEQLADRLDALERENRKQAASLRSLRLIGALLLPAVLLAQAWLVARAAPTGDTLRAKRFVLEDDAGRTTAALEMKGGHPRLVIFKGDKEAVEINGGVLSPIMTMTLWDGANEVTTTGIGPDGLSASGTSRGFIHLGPGSLELGPDEKRSGFANVRITSNVDESSITTSSPAGAIRLEQSKGGPSLAIVTKKKQVNLSCDEDGPRIGLKDAEGYELSLGRSALKNTKTGAKTTTSAASVRMFDPRGNAVWSAP